MAPFIYPAYREWHSAPRLSTSSHNYPPSPLPVPHAPLVLRKRRNVWPESARRRVRAEPTSPPLPARRAGYPLGGGLGGEGRLGVRASIIRASFPGTNQTRTI